MGYLQAAAPAIISGCTLLVVSGLAAFIKRQLKSYSEQLAEFRGEHKILLESQRNQLKASIVQTFEQAQDRGYITAMELETLNRRADSYFALGGNHYIHAVVKQANEMQIRGELPL